MQYLLLEGAKKLRKKLIPTLPTSTRPRKKKTNVDSRQYQSETCNFTHYQMLPTKANSQSGFPKLRPDSCSQKASSKAGPCIAAPHRCPRKPSRLFILEPPPAACDKMQVYDTAHLLFQACVSKLVVKIQVRALQPCCDKTTKVDDMAHQLLRLVLRYHCYRCML
jgi:hypothetical protein